MKPKHLVSVRDLSADQIRRLFQVAAKLKKSKSHINTLSGKTLGLLFQKPSVRTRVSFEVGMHQLGGHSLYIGPVELQEGQRESAKDLARVLSRYLDGIVARTFSHQDVEDLAHEAAIPVINGLSDHSHPCQALSDLFTMQEKFKKLQGLKVAYTGDGNNVCHSLMEACGLMGVDFRVATPRSYQPQEKIYAWARSRARASGGRIVLTQDPQEAVLKAQVVYTDVWTSMGQEEQKGERLKAFEGFQVNQTLMKRAAPQAVFMHCLPAHRGEEVSGEVIDGPRSIVFDQTENRLHVQKAILLMLLGAR